MDKNDVIVNINPQIEEQITTIAEAKNASFDNIVNLALKQYIRDNYRLIKENHQVRQCTALTLAGMR